MAVKLDGLGPAFSCSNSRSRTAGVMEYDGLKNKVTKLAGLAAWS